MLQELVASLSSSPGTLLRIELLRSFILLALQVLNGILEEVHLLLILGIKPDFDDAIWSLVLDEVEVDGFLERFLRLSLLQIALHELVDFDTFEGADLSDILFECGEAATDTDHDLVRFNHEYACLRTDHILALISCSLALFKLDYRQECDQDDLQLSLAHDPQVLELFNYGAPWAFASLPRELVLEPLLFDQVARIVDTKHLFLDDLRPCELKIRHDVIKFAFERVEVFLCVLTGKSLLLREYVADDAVDLLTHFLLRLGDVLSLLFIVFQVHTVQVVSLPVLSETVLLLSFYFLLDVDQVRL